MRFLDNNGVSMSHSFSEEEFNLPLLKEQFNSGFVKNNKVRACKMFFYGNNINSSFIAGIREGHVVIINTATKEEYSPKEFSNALAEIDNFLNNSKCLA